MRKPILVLALVLLVAMPAFGQWQGEFRLTNTSGSSYTCNNSGWAVAANDADVHVVWYDYSFGYNRSRHMTFPIGSPATSTAGTGLYSSYYTDQTSVATSANGNAHVSFRRTNYPYYYPYFREYNGSSWGGTSSWGWGSPYRNYYPMINDDADGNTHFAMSRYYYYRSGSYRYYQYYPYYRYRPAGGSIGGWYRMYTPAQYSSGSYRYRRAYYPCVTANGSGMRHASMAEYGFYRLVHCYSSNGTSWNYEYITGTNQANTHYTSICTDPDDNVYIAYQSRSPYDIWVASNVSGSWQTVNVSDYPASSSYDPSIACDTFGNVWVVWRDQRAGNYQVFCSRLEYGADFTNDWETPTQLSNTTYTYVYRPKIAADLNGNVHVVWTDRRDGNYEIYYNWYTPPTGGGGGELDLEMAEIIRPYFQETGGEAFTPSCRIYNPVEEEPEFMAATVDAEIRCRIKDMATQQTVYEDVLHSYPLDFGYNEVNSFRSFTPEGDMLYEVLFVVTHPDDIDEQNNDMTRQFTTERGFEVAATQIIQPTEFENLPFEPEAEFTELSELETPDVTLNCRISDLELSAVVYDTFLPPRTFAANEAYTGLFPLVEGLPDGGYHIEFWATDAEGGDLGDHMSMDFEYLGIEESPLDATYALQPIAPFVGEATVGFSVAADSRVALKVYDITGKLVTTLADKSFTAGNHAVTWSADVAPGVYFVRFVTPEFNTCQKVMVIR